MDGILLIDKPKGWTSFDVVAKIRGIVRQETGQKKPKVGHAGTLDPLATGLLVVLVGSYCKRAQEFSKLDKTYKTEVMLGQNSTTDDDEGEKTQISDKKPSLSDVEAVLGTFLGDQYQIPPRFSAIKVDGKRAYKQARAGKEVVLEPRKVKIYDITDVEYAYPIIKFEVKVSSGTYIRSLARDLGKKLGTGAYMSQLERTEIAQFGIEEAQDITTISPATITKHLLTQSSQQPTT